MRSMYSGDTDLSSSCWRLFVSYAIIAVSCFVRGLVHFLLRDSREVVTLVPRELTKFAGPPKATMLRLGLLCGRPVDDFERDIGDEVE
jgi:hypothetical protein